MLNIIPPRQLGRNWGGRSDIYIYIYMLGRIWFELSTRRQLAIKRTIRTVPFIAIFGDAYELKAMNTSTMKWYEVIELQRVLTRVVRYDTILTIKTIRIYPHFQSYRTVSLAGRIAMAFGRIVSYRIVPCRTVSRAYRIVSFRSKRYDAQL